MLANLFGGRGKKSWEKGGRGIPEKRALYHLEKAKRI